MSQNGGYQELPVCLVQQEEAHPDLCHELQLTLTLHQQEGRPVQHGLGLRQLPGPDREDGLRMSLGHGVRLVFCLLFMNSGKTL